MELDIFKKKLNEKDTDFLADSQHLILDSTQFSRLTEKVVYNMQSSLEY
jgi:hypothetical protein